MMLTGTPDEKIEMTTMKMIKTTNEEDDDDQDDQGENR
jgi:hypothetical protein